MKRVRPPVAQGDELQLEVIAIDGYKEGIAKKDNFVIFITGNVRKGEIYKVRINKVFRTYAMAERV